MQSQEIMATINGNTCPFIALDILIYTFQNMPRSGYKKMRTVEMLVTNNMHLCHFKL